MKAKDRAEDFYYKMLRCECEDGFLSQNKSRAKNQAIIMCDEIINAIDSVNKASDYHDEYHDYINEVKEEINKIYQNKSIEPYETNQI